MPFYIIEKAIRNLSLFPSHSFAKFRSRESGFRSKQLKTYLVFENDQSENLLAYSSHLPIAWCTRENLPSPFSFTQVRRYSHSFTKTASAINPHIRPHLPLLPPLLFRIHYFCFHFPKHSTPTTLPTSYMFSSSANAHRVDKLFKSASLISIST